MIKVVLPSSFGFDVPLAELVPLHSRGVDASWLVKRASQSVSEAFDGIKPEPGRSLIHLIAMGAADRYGSNRNGDAFYRGPVELPHVDADWDSIKVADGSTEHRSPATWGDRTTTGLKDRHATFAKHARVWGGVKASAYNDDMDRVELLIDVDNGEWGDDLQKIASGQDVPFSMACSLDPAAPVLTPTGYRPIIDLKVGDLVFTGKGRWKPVTKLVRRKYSGEVVSIKARGFPVELSLTADHPMLAVCRGIPVPAGDAGDHERGKWTHATHIKAGDSLLYRAPQDCPGAEPFDSPYLCSFLGELLDSGPEGIPPAELAAGKAFLGEQVSTVPPGMLNSPPECKLAFVGAALDNGNAGSTDSYVSWQHRDLLAVMAVRDLLGSLDIPAEIHQVTQPERPYELRIPHLHISSLAYYSRHVNTCSETVRAIGKATRDDMHCFNLFTPMAVEAAGVRWVVQQDVYNIEVEEDESYVIGGLVSHNCKVPFDICSVCMHKAASTDKYCKHLSEGMTDLLKTGHVVAAVNESPTFFDISRVHRPADRIAWSLMKAAEVAMPRGAELARDPDYAPVARAELTPRQARLLDKLAQMEKRLPAMGSIKKYGPGLSPAKCSVPVPDTAVKKASFLKAAASRGVVLPIADWLAVWSVGEVAVEKLASAMAPHMAGVFTAARDTAAEPSTVLADAYRDGAMEKAAEALVPALGWGMEAVRRRAIARAISGGEAGKQAEAVSMPEGRARQLAASYGMYKLAALEVMLDGGLVDEDTLVELAVVHNCVQ